MVELSEDDGFGEFVRRSSRELQRSAWLMCGDWQTAQDLVQAALLATWPHWDEIRRQDAPQVYVYRVMVNKQVHAQRRHWRGELPTADLPDEPAATSELNTDLRDGLRRALSALPDKQRNVVVLRYFVDLSETDTARAVGCSVGAVKSHASRAMQTLRRSPALAGYFQEGARL